MKIIVSFDYSTVLRYLDDGENTSTSTSILMLMLMRYAMHFYGELNYK